jgi:hypothetical protein
MVAAGRCRMGLWPAEMPHHRTCGIPIFVIQKENLTNILAEAAKVVDEAGVPEDLRAAAFQAAVQALTAEGEGSGDPSGATPQATEGPLASIAATLGLELPLVADVYFEDGDRLGIGVAASKLERGKSAGARQLALLVAAGRQAGGYEEWTPSSEIRHVCDDFGRFDSSNFASTLADMGDVFQIRGSRQQREVRLKRPGLEAAGQLIRKLGGEGSE